MRRPEAWAIIPARGGSKGIPRKNVRLLGGHPLVAHTILAAQRAKSVCRVAVTTDDDEIAEVASRYGAAVVRRPAELATDTASSEAALLHALRELEIRWGYLPERTVFLQCTSALMLPEDIDGTVQALLEDEADCAFSASEFFGFLWSKEANTGAAVGLNHNPATRPRRQERKGQFLENGAVYVFQTTGFLAARHRFFGRIAIHDMPAERATEIDEPSDLAIVEARFEARARDARAVSRGDKGTVHLVDTYVGPPRPEANTQATPQVPDEATHELRAQAIFAGPIALVAMDFDGVFTDDRVSIDETGRESVRCSRADGLGLSSLKADGLDLVVVSKERNPVVSRRCEKLGIACLQGIDDKLAAMTALCEEKGLVPNQVIFVGNDVNDVSCLRAFIGIVVADAHPQAAAAAQLVLRRPGGRGALRELCDGLLAARHARRVAEANEPPLDHVPPQRAAS